jgi:hypothetical protein
MIASCGQGASAWQVKIDSMTINPVTYCHATLVYHDGEWRTIPGTATLKPNRWYHIAITREITDKGFDLNDPNRYAVTTRIYINGVLDLDSTSMTAALPRGGDFTSGVNCPMVIGMDLDYPDTGFVGAIDELRISNSVRDYQPVVSNFKALYDRSAVGTELLIDFDNLKSSSPLSYYVASVDNATAYTCTINPTTSGYTVPSLASISSNSGVPGFGSYLHVAGGNSITPQEMIKPAQVADSGMARQQGYARTSTVAVEAYVRLASYPDGSANYKKYVVVQNGEHPAWQLSVNSDKHAQFSYTSSDSMSEIKVAGKTELQLNRWYHISGVKKTRFTPPGSWNDYTQMEIYVDGMLEGTLPNALRPDAYNLAADSLYRAIFLGSSPLWGTAVLDGDIDEVRISSLPRIYGAYGSCQAGDYDPADFNRDCKINFADFAQMASSWLQCNDKTKAGCVY